MPLSTIARRIIWCDQPDGGGRSIIICWNICPVAQWIRHRSTEPGIAGSSPAGVILQYVFSGHMASRATRDGAWDPGITEHTEDVIPLVSQHTTNPRVESHTSGLVLCFSCCIIVLVRVALVSRCVCSKHLTLARLEPAIFGSEDQRLIH